ncbi:hypothetical protein ScPMuIL_008395 [Solemya velum]
MRGTLILGVAVGALCILTVSPQEAGQIGTELAVPGLNVDTGTAEPVELECGVRLLIFWRGRSRRTGKMAKRVAGSLLLFDSPLPFWLP